MYLRKSIFYGLCLVIAVLSLSPSSGVPSYSIENLDKVAHFIIYASLSFVMLRFYWNNRFDRKSIIYTCGFSISYGILLEILQNTSFSQREFDIFDIIANIIGALSGIALFKLLKK